MELPLHILGTSPLVYETLTLSQSQQNLRSWEMVVLASRLPEMYTLHYSEMPRNLVDCFAIWSLTGVALPCEEQLLKSSTRINQIVEASVESPLSKSNGLACISELT